jgi:hypothetical protein
MSIYISFSAYDEKSFNSVWRKIASGEFAHSDLAKVESLKEEVDDFLKVIKGGDKKSVKQAILKLSLCILKLSEEENFTENLFPLLDYLEVFVYETLGISLHNDKYGDDPGKLSLDQWISAFQKINPEIMQKIMEKLSCQSKYFEEEKNDFFGILKKVSGVIKKCNREKLNLAIYYDNDSYESNFWKDKIRIIYKKLKDKKLLNE